MQTWKTSFTGRLTVMKSFNFHLILFSALLYNDEFTFYPALKKQTKRTSTPPAKKKNNQKNNQGQKGRQYPEISAHCLKITLNVFCVIKSIWS